jgi:hypothetical protein
MKTMRKIALAAVVVVLSAQSALAQTGRVTGGGGGASGGGTGGAGGGVMTPATGARARGAGAGGVGGAAAGPSGGSFGPPSASASYTCEVGEQLANLGIGTFYCQGGDCRVAGIFATASLPTNVDGTTALPDRPTSVASLLQFRAGTPENRDPKDWSFTVEPSLWEIHARGPASGKVREGDVLVAVNSVPVTTPNATFVLGNMVAGRPINLTVRRGDAIVPVQVFPTAGCLTFGVSSGSSDLPGTLMRDERGRIVNRSDGTVVVP